MQKFCEGGNQVVITQGLNSTTKVQKSYPQCTVTVYLTGTTTPAAIFSDNLSIPTPLANPFTANVDGSFGFYVSPAACYDVVTSGAGFPAPFTYSYICLGAGGGGGSGTVAGTPPHVAKFTGTTTVGDSSGLDPGNTPTQWPLGLNVIAGAGYLQDTVGSGGVTANQLVQFDSSGNIIVAVVSANRPKGIADIGGVAGASVPRAVWGVHACVFDNQTTANDFVAPSSTVAGDCSDVGSVKPNNVTIIGTVKTANSGAATLANVDLLPWDTIAPGSGGGSGTVSSCATTNSNAYYSAIGTIVVCDPDVTDDGNGNTTMKSAGFTDTAHAGFWFETAGPTPAAAPANSTQFQVGTTISTPNTFLLPVAAGAVDVGKVWGVSSSTTDTNGNPVDVMSLITAGGGGGGASKIPFDSCDADQTINKGDSYWRTVTYAASAGVASADIASWGYAPGLTGTVICKLEIPSNASGTIHVFLDLASADATAGHTAAFKVCYAVSSSRQINNLSYTCTATQNYTSTATAFVNTRLDFTTASATVGEYFIANIIQNSGGTNTAEIGMTAKAKVF